jgi:uncharacterized protein (DUF427 family)
MSVRTEAIDKWVRAFVGDVAVVDSRAPLLFWEDAFPVPFYAFRPADVRTDLLTPATGDPPTQPFFHLPMGPVRQWFDLEVDGRTIPHVAWIRDTPELADMVVVSWQPGLIDSWLEEDEPVFGHPRDPYKRVEALSSRRHVVVSLEGVVLADSTSPVLLFETHLPTRYYLPADDVDLSALTASANESHCPYKGVADRYWHVSSGPRVANAAWSYSEPFPAVGKIKDRIAFYNELVDIELDGIDQPRPESVFSRREHRPGS